MSFVTKSLVSPFIIKYLFPLRKGAQGEKGKELLRAVDIDNIYFTHGIK